MLTMIHFVNITEEEFLKTKILYKHLPLENALRTLKDKSLWFANPSTWKDPFEKRFLEAKYIKNGKEVNFNWKGRLFCTCMTQTVSSEAFWNTYSRGNIGIELRIYKEKLLEELSRYDSKHKIFIGKAEYLRTDEICKGLRSIPFNPPIPSGADFNTGDIAARLFLLKRIAYKYEDEIRIIVVKDSATKEKGIGLDYTCENTDLIQKIVLDPNLEDYTYQLLNDFFEKEYGFTSYIKSGKLHNRVLRSQLYTQQGRATLKLD